MKKISITALKEFEDILRYSKYSKSKSYEYQGNNVLVVLNCNEHGDFPVMPKNFKRSKGRAGCEGCSSSRKAKEHFEEMLSASIYKKANGFEYIKANKKVILECPEHGSFKIMPEKFRIGQGCSDCSRTSPAKALSDLLSLLEDENYIESDSFKYTGADETVDIICPAGHPWSVTPGSFKGGTRCGQCAANSPLRSEGLFIDLVYKRGFSLGEKYVYTKNSEAVWIECPIHGPMETIPNNFKNGNGCKKCSGKCVEQAKEKFERNVILKGFHFPKKYRYKTQKDSVWLQCLKHKNFKIVPKDFILNKYGCPECYGVTPKQAKKRFERNVSDRRFRYGDGYKYINSTSHVHLICPEGHPCPDIIPDAFNQGRGCRVCSRNDPSTSKKDFLNQLHLNQYFMTRRVPYLNTDTKVELVCPENHKWLVTPASFKNGVRCNFCNLLASQSSGEKVTEDFLIKYGMEYIAEYSPVWLGKQRIDFYLIDYNVGLEVNGGHHYTDKETIKRDKVKYEKMKENNLDLIVVDAYHGIRGRIDTIDKNKTLFLERLKEAIFVFVVTEMIESR